MWTNSSANPEVTRANSCPAYVSFQFVTENNVRECIVRLMPEHCGHSLLNHKENAINRVDDELVQCINECLLQGLSNSEILLRSVEWAQNCEEMDLRNRRYNVTLEDIKSIGIGFNARQIMDGNVSIAVDKLIKSDLRDSIFF